MPLLRLYGVGCWERGVGIKIMNERRQKEGKINAKQMVTLGSYEREEGKKRASEAE
jgi:hypothetical protein